MYLNFDIFFPLWIIHTNIKLNSLTLKRKRVYIAKKYFMYDLVLTDSDRFIPF